MPQCRSLHTLLFAGALLVALTSGCSSFGREWKRAATPSTLNALEGRWEGEWRSDANGHHGRLRAIATPQGTNLFRIRYRATYGWFLRFGYTMDTRTQPSAPDALEFSGAAHLGVWGEYRCQGRATAHSFEAQYDSKFDRGIFRMQRPGADPG